MLCILPVVIVLLANSNSEQARIGRMLFLLPVVILLLANSNSEQARIGRMLCILPVVIMLLANSNSEQARIRRMLCILPVVIVLLANSNSEQVRPHLRVFLFKESIMDQLCTMSAIMLFMKYYSTYIFQYLPDFLPHLGSS
jgi:hypothetical protein